MGLIQKLTMVPRKSDNVTAVVGGMDSASSPEAAKTWLRSILGGASIDGIVDIYSKGNPNKFNGMLFVKFASPDSLGSAIQIFNGLQSKFGNKISFMNPDRPLQERVKTGFLNGFKKLLLSDSWDFPKTMVKYNTTSMNIEVGNKPVLKVDVQDNKFILKWMDQEWADWKELRENPEFAALEQLAQTKLDNAKGMFGKGKGKKGAVA